MTEKTKIALITAAATVLATTASKLVPDPEPKAKEAQLEVAYDLLRESFKELAQRQVEQDRDLSRLLGWIDVWRWRMEAKAGRPRTGTGRGEGALPEAPADDGPGEELDKLVKEDKLLPERRPKPALRVPGKFRRAVQQREE